MARFAFFVAALFLGLLPPAWAAGNKATFGPCQLDKAQNFQTWPFEIQYVKELPSWTAEKSAADLQLAQTQYFSGKSSPFMRSAMPAELGYYEPTVRFEVKPFVTYSQTIDGRPCAKVVGARLVANHSSVIYLARELSERNCVSRSALSHQMLHDKVAKMTIEALLGDKEEIKNQVFAIYEKQGAAGRTQEEIAKQLGLMGKAATRAAQEKTNMSIRANRKQHVETAANFKNLYRSCSGEFEKASKLAEKR
jgi:hypothetical protein